MVDKDNRKNLVEIRGVDKRYELDGEVTYALAGIDLDIYQGEYLSLMGPSGSGKSTLFNMIGALDVPTGGTVTVGGVSLPDLSSQERSYFRGKHIGYVFQAYNLIPFLSALENVSLSQTLMGADDEEARERAVEKLTYVGLGERLDHTPGELSGGQQQRVAIARALVNDPAILLADEPTANLDFKTGEQIIEIFRNLVRDSGVTVISATHDHRMLAVSDRIVWIKSGKIDKIEEVDEMDIKVGSIH